MNKELDIEEKLIESRDNLQVQYLQDYTYSKNEIIIIDNTPLVLTLQKYLVQLGFENIYLCRTAKEGVEVFRKLVKMGKLIPVILNDIVDKNIKNLIIMIIGLQKNILEVLIHLLNM